MARAIGRSHHPLKKPHWTPGNLPKNYLTLMPDPPNTITRFLILEYAHGWNGDTLDIKTITDVPCHLYLRYTSKPLRVHMTERPDRGTLAMKTPTYCFVQWTEIEQDQPGDTYHHIFHLPTFGVDQQRWYYIRGNIGAEESDSVSCAFEVKYHEESQMITLGIYGQTQTLEGEVKLEQGDGVILTRDDAKNSIKIEAIPAGGGAYTFITSKVLTGAGILDLINLVTTDYPILIVKYAVTCVAVSNHIRLTLQGDSAARYHQERTLSYATTNLAAEAYNQAFVNLGLVGASSDVWPTVGEITLFNPLSLTKNLIGHQTTPGAGAGKQFFNDSGARYTSTTVEKITRITIRPDAGNFVIGSLAYLFGVKLA